MRHSKGRDQSSPMLELRRKVLLGCWVLAFAALLGRSVQLQVMEHDEWRQKAEAQHHTTTTMPAPRGAIYDRTGTALAVSQERWEIGIAPREIRDPVATARVLAAALGAREQDMLAHTTKAVRWVVVPGRYSPRVREALRGVQGVHLRQELTRAYPRGDLAMGLLGNVLDGTGVGGIEEAFDEVLRGSSGSAVSPRDVNGKAIAGQTYIVDPPQAGGSVELTLDMDLQEIGQEALERAIERTGARGGDLLVIDPRTGDILAMVSLRGGRNAGLSGLNTPYEPGSTLKPFTVAAMLESGVATLEDRISIGNGVWTFAGRTLRDVYPKDSVLTLADALRVSSNVGIAKFAQALTPEIQYLTLRDFGFGTPTAVGIPGESSGTLRRPSDWSGQSPASLAIGYEISVTPLQLATAYGAIANGGLLMEPRLIKTVRDVNGEVIEEHEPRVVRRVVSKETAEALSRVLEDVVEDGTGTALRMQTFAVAGKSGTSKIAGPGGYIAGEYFSSFVGFFPADDPQLVVLVKLDDTQGNFFGGATAAPVTRETLEAILAARRSPLDLRAVARSTRVSSTVSASGLHLRFASLSAADDDDEVALPGASSDADVRPESGGEVVVPVPDVEGLSLRVAVRRLHALGLRVDRVGDGDIRYTVPAAGSRLAAGDTVVLYTGTSTKGARRE